MTKHVKIISILSLIVLTTFAIRAQDDLLRIKGGLNLSTINIDNSDNTYKAGFMGGLSFHLPVTQRVAIQPELLFSSNGSKAEYNESFAGLEIADGETKFTLNYLDIPVLLSLGITDDIYFNVGPYASYLLSAKSETSGEILDFIDVDNSEDIDREHFNSMDFGLMAGIEVNVDPIFVGAGYKWGMNSIAKSDDDIAETLLEDSKNRVFQVYVGLQF